MSGAGIPWSKADDARLAVLWAEGHTCAVLAREFGRSRNGIVGRVHRLHLPPRPSPIPGHVPKPLAVRPQRAVQPVIVAPPVWVPPPPPPAPAVRACQWIEGDDPRAWVFCGRPAYRSSPYCGPHFHRCYQHYGARREAA